jgi:hypothetical protein
MDVRITSTIVFAVLFGACSVFVGHLLRTNGLVFLERVFGTENRVAEATNALLNVGYYLLCLSLLCLNAGVVSQAADGIDAIRAIASRLGSSILVVAVIHFINMFIFTVMFRRASAEDAERKRVDDLMSTAKGSASPL